MSGESGAEIRCPFCESAETDLMSLFGQQLLTVQYYCNGCRTPFERVKGEDVLSSASPGIVKSHGAHAATAGGVAAPPSWVASMARQSGARNGDPEPSTVQVVLSTRQRAVQLTSGNSVYSDEAIYLVVLRGQFVDTDARTPRGQPVYGTVLTLNIDASSRTILDFGLSDKVPPLAQLGPVWDITTQLQAP